VRLCYLAPLVLLLAACNRDKTKGAPSDPSLLEADAFCRLLFEAPKRHLATHCSAEDQARAEYARLGTVASRPVAACTAVLEPSRAAGRLKLHKPAAEACAKALEAASWKTTLRGRQIAAHPECKELTTGSQTENAPCRTSLDCQNELWCSGASFETDGACKKKGALGDKCDAPLLFLFDETAASCTAGNACDFGPFRPAYALGDSSLFSRALEKELAKRRSVPTQPEAPNAALRDAAEFGMIGLLGAGDAGAGGRGEGIGLGSIGGGFGSSTGRLGTSGSTPKVRMGATTVNGRLPPEVIQRIVRQNFGRFRMCYEAGLKRNPKLGGEVSVNFVISRDGSVTQVGGGGDLPDPSVVECVTRAFKSLSFPQPEGGIVRVKYPIRFSPGDDASGTETGAPDASAPVASASDASAPDASANAAEADATADASPRAESKPIDSPLSCIARIARGTACTASHHCANGLLCRAGHCESPGKTGESCESDLECQGELYCGASVDASGVRGVCKALEPAGASCNHSSECRGACSDGKCIAFCGAG
jgi:hypothetical protein